MNYEAVAAIVTVVIAVAGAFWRASQVFVTKDEFNKRCESVDEGFDKVNARADKLDERQQKHEVLTARLDASISGLEKAVNGLTDYLQKVSLSRNRNRREETE